MEQLKNELTRFSEERGMSFTQIAKAMGIGASTLSEWRKGSYTGDVETLNSKVEDFLNRHKYEIRRIDFSVDTEAKRKVYYVINTIQKYVTSNVANRLLESAKIGYIFGRAGLGKTHAIREYIREYKGRGILVTAESGITAVGLIKRIARELKLDDVGNAETVKTRIKEAVKFTETIIIIDEGEHLKASVIDIVRSIADQTGIGIVIAGTESLKSLVFSQKKQYEYLYSRAVVNMTLKDLSLEDTGNIVRAFLKNEIELYSEKELQDLINYIDTTVRGSARQLANLLTSSSEIANQNEARKITRKHILAAVTTLAL